MSKKFLKNPQLTTSRQLTDHNPYKITDIKQLSSPYKKTPISNTKTTLNSKNSLPNSNIKPTQENSETPEDQGLAKTKSKIKEDSNHVSAPLQKIVKKAVSPVPSSQNLKKFSKTSKIPTLRSTTAKGASDESESECVKNMESKMFVQESSAQTSSVNNMTEQSSAEVSVLKQQVEVLKSENEELKKQNEKLAKKIQKLRSLNDQNKKLLKERIENFNSEGENLRKLKDQINKLEIVIEKLKEKVLELEDQNIFLRNNVEKINTPKISREIQTIILDRTEESNEKVHLNNLMPQFNPQRQKLPKQQNDKNIQQKYQSSSSRKSYGGILPLQTVVKLNASRFRINFRANQTTPKKNPANQHKLMQKYENYWSEKFEKQPRKAKNPQHQNDQVIEARSQYMANNKKCVTSCEYEEHNDELMNLQMETVNQKKHQDQQQEINQRTNVNKLDEKNRPNTQQNTDQKPEMRRTKREDYRKQLEGRIQSLRYISGQTQYLQQMHNQKQGFSPTILIQNYRKISQQQQLIKSLYRVIQELSKEIQTIQKRQDDLIQQNRQLKVRLKRVSLEKEIADRNNAEKFMVHLSSEEQVLDQMKDDTLLLDQTKQDKPLNNQHSTKKPKLTSAQRVNQLLIFQNYEPLPSQQKPSQPHQHLFKAKSALNLNLNQTRIIDEISRFCHSQVLCHDSFDSFAVQLQKNNEDNSFEKMQGMQGKSSDNKSSTKQQEAFRNMDELDRKILAGTLGAFEYTQSKGILNERGNISEKQKNSSKISFSNKQYEEIQTHKIHYELNQLQLQKLDEQEIRIEDSLDALQYFSDNTPENINLSQNVSAFNQTLNPLNTTQQSSKNTSKEIFCDHNQQQIQVLSQSLIRVDESQISTPSNV